MENGDFSVLNSEHGYVAFRVGMGLFNVVTAAAWASDRQVFLGCVSGAVYLATFHVTPCPTKKMVHLVEVLHELISAVCALSYDAKTKLLAVGYHDRVAVWRQIPGKRRSTWEIVDFHRVRPSHIATGINSLHFFGPDTRLLVCSELGVTVWSQEKKLTPVDMDDEVHRIAGSAISSNGSMLAAWTLDDTITILPLSPQGPLTILAQKHSLVSGRGRYSVISRTLIAFTDDHNVVYGTFDGSVVVIGYDGELLQKLTYEMHCTKAIVTNRDTLYAAFTDSVGLTTLVAYSNKDVKKRVFDVPHPEPAFYFFYDVFEESSDVQSSIIMPLLLLLVAVFLITWAMYAWHAESQSQRQACDPFCGIRL
ncbi:hypothetical protein FRC06_002493 [Ceratobasidium sp. 370]|nr:hypothetical protein FRC06_002493 [Ceratobasidium sp. 370]